MRKVWNKIAVRRRGRAPMVGPAPPAGNSLYAQTYSASHQAVSHKSHAVSHEVYCPPACPPVHVPATRRPPPHTHTHPPPHLPHLRRLPLVVLQQQLERVGSVRLGLGGSRAGCVRAGARAKQRPSGQHAFPAEPCMSRLVGHDAAQYTANTHRTSANAPTQAAVRRFDLLRAAGAGASPKAPYPAVPGCYSPCPPLAPLLPLCGYHPSPLAPVASTHKARAAPSSKSATVASTCSWLLTPPPAVHIHAHLPHLPPTGVALALEHLHQRRQRHVSHPAAELGAPRAEAQQLHRGQLAASVVRRKDGRCCSYYLHEAHEGIRKVTKGVRGGRGRRDVVTAALVVTGIATYGSMSVLAPAAPQYRYQDVDRCLQSRMQDAQESDPERTRLLTTSAMCFSLFTSSDRHPTAACFSSTSPRSSSPCSSGANPALKISSLCRAGIWSWVTSREGWIGGRCKRFKGWSGVKAGGGGGRVRGQLLPDS